MQHNDEMVELGIECIAGFGTAANPIICNAVYTPEIIAYCSTLMETKHCSSVVMFFANILADDLPESTQ